MEVLGVDLASRYSAAVLLGPGGLALSWFHAESVRGFWTKVVHYCNDSSDRIVLIEDIPYGVRWDTNTRRAAHAQGAILSHLERETCNPVLWVSPAIWQRHHAVYKKGKEGAHKAALALGFDVEDVYPMPPPTRGSAEARSLARKVQTDYDDAFLIGRFGQALGSYDGLVQAGCVRY